MIRKCFSLTGLWLVLSLAPLGVSGAVYALSEPEELYRSHHLSPEQLIKLQQEGDILSLEEIIRLLKRSGDDRLLEVELLERKGYLFYKVEILEKSGIVKKYMLDARTGQPVTRHDQGE
ncbi:PepSY domain-containing protein [Emcibacter nanhaiensis]